MNVYRNGGVVVKKLTVEEGLRLVAGVFVIASIGLGLWANPWWFALTAFVGLNLLQSAFSGWCPMMSVLRWAGLPSAPR